METEVLKAMYAHVSWQISLKLAECTARFLERYHNFLVLKMAAILDSVMFKFLTAFGSIQPSCVTVPDFIKISHYVAEISRFFDFEAKNIFVFQNCN